MEDLVIGLPTDLALSPVPTTRQLRIDGAQKIVIKGKRTNHKIDVVCPLFFQVIESEVGERPWAIAFAIPPTTPNPWIGVRMMFT